MKNTFTVNLSEEAFERLSEVVAYLEYTLDMDFSFDQVASTIICQVVLPGEDLNEASA